MKRWFRQGVVFYYALVSLWRKLGEKTLLKLKEQQYEAAGRSKTRNTGVLLRPGSS